MATVALLFFSKPHEASSALINWCQRLNDDILILLCFAFQAFCVFLASVASVLAAPQGPGPLRGPLIGGPGGPFAGGPRPLIGGPRPGPGPLLGARPLGVGPIGAGPIGVGPLGAGPLGAGPIGAGPLGPGPFRPGPLVGGPGPLIRGPGPIAGGPILGGPGPIGGPVIAGPGPIAAGPVFAGPGPIVARPVIAPVPAYGAVAPAYGEPAYNGPAVYSFDYGVRDEYAGLNFGHSENRDGYKTEGTYYVNLPDGRLQTVNYHADEAGYIADVQYSGAPVVPAYGPAPVIARPAYVP